MVHGPDPFEDVLKRPITTIPPSITTTHHDGGLPSQLSYTLADDDPPHPLHAYPKFTTKFKGKAPISKWWVNKMGGSAACGQIRSKTSNGKDHSTPNHNHTPWWWLALPIVLHPCRWRPSPPLHVYPTFATKFKRKAPILKWWVDEMGGSATRRQIQSKTSNWEGWLGVLEESRGRIWTISRTPFIWFGWWQPRRCPSRWKDKTEMDCRTVTAWTRDGYVTLLLPASLPSTARVPHQDICSKETEGEKEKKDRENRKLWCGKWWKVDQGGGWGCVCKAAQWHQTLRDQWSQQGWGQRRTSTKRATNLREKFGLCENWEWWLLCVLP